MNRWKSDVIEINGLRLHYTRTGGDKPPLVLAHGFSEDGLVWTALAEVLEDQYDLIMPDARGHGQSDPGGMGQRQCLSLVTSNLPGSLPPASPMPSQASRKIRENPKGIVHATWASLNNVVHCTDAIYRICTMRFPA
jgi:pimeloyl-ACP methyl ester carboxylesterase